MAFFIYYLYALFLLFLVFFKQFFFLFVKGFKQFFFVLGQHLERLIKTPLPLEWPLRRIDVSVPEFL